MRKRLLALVLMTYLVSMVSAAETDYETVGGNITASIGLIGNVIDGIVAK
jgi:hypothetical protein